MGWRQPHFNAHFQIAIKQKQYKSKDNVNVANVKHTNTMF